MFSQVPSYTVLDRAVSRAEAYYDPITFKIVVKLYGISSGEMFIHLYGHTWAIHRVDGGWMASNAEYQIPLVVMERDDYVTLNFDERFLWILRT